jgi:thiol-disulfide isomerase/thioredoxin
VIARAGFLKAVAAAAVLPTATPAPQPSPSLAPWDMCSKNEALPYDRPLGLKLRVLDGPDFDLLKYRGKSVLLNVFATWCPPCNEEMPYLVEAAGDYADKGLVVIGIDDRESDEDVRAFRKKFHIPFPIAMDQSGWIVRALEVGTTRAETALPTSFFIDPNGYLYCDRIGSVSRQELRYRIERFVNAKPG